MRLAIMQPYFMPYIGYFQLIAAVDQFIVYDNIKYTKKGWINRNRMLLNDSDATFSVPLKKDSDALDIVERELALDFDRTKLLNQFRGAYSRAPYFAKTFPLLERIVGCEEANLFRYIHYSLVQTCAHLGIGTQIRISSDVAIDHGLKSQEKLLAICAALSATTYINSIGGVDSYSNQAFEQSGVVLRFLRPKAFAYPQFKETFVPWLSIIDVLMFNTVEATHGVLLNNMELIQN